MPNLPNPGDRIGAVDGPCQNPRDRAGTVMCLVTDRWGTHAVVMMDSGKTETVHTMNAGPGIGWHYLKN